MWRSTRSAMWRSSGPLDVHEVQGNAGGGWGKRGDAERRAEVEVNYGMVRCRSMKAEDECRETKEKNVLGKCNWRSEAEEQLVVAQVAEIFEQDGDLGDERGRWFFEWCYSAGRFDVGRRSYQFQKSGELDVVIEWDGKALVEHEVLQSATQSRHQKRVAVGIKGIVAHGEGLVLIFKVPPSRETQAH
ncbi:hypothetical protein C8R44DRAFT_748451 [Mycena epipterygia]|nr:hypothetical protein C8R44DRAFT_748451 [Mycena epipterygia]